MTTKITEKNISSLANAGVQWQSVVVADGSTGTTGSAGEGYFINTTSAAHIFTLPAIATFADTILIKDYAGTFATNALTIARNGHKIQGVENNSLINTNRASVTLVYVDVTRGWEFVTESNVADLQFSSFITATGGTVTTSGNFKIHSFTGDGCFVVSTLGIGPAGGPSNVDYLVVAGGGGGQSNYSGGGAGGYRTTFPSPGCNAGSFPVTATTFPITVGAGGTGNAPVFSNLTGSPSIFSTITSAGGGGGNPGSSPSSPSTPGGSGAGGFGEPCSPGGNIGGTGNSPPVSPPQGNPGGTSTVGARRGGGGGGAGGAGGTATGGAGSSNSISGSAVTYAGGGGGGTENTPGSPYAGGAGGGGNGGNRGSVVAQSGTVNTGGGGGAGSRGTCGTGTFPAGNGGSGIVVIRYKFQ